MSSSSFRTGFRVLVALAAGLVALVYLLTASAAQARTEPVSLRVEGPRGSLERGAIFYVGGQEPFGLADDACAPTGDFLRVQGKTAMGLLGAARRINRGLRPVLVQRFDFGDLVCSIGGEVGKPFDPDTGSFSGWIYKVNSAAGTGAADDLRVGRGDRVLWYFQSTFAGESRNNGPELLLRAPARDSDDDGALPARVFELDAAGSPSPAAGAVVRGGTSTSAPTDTRGWTEVPVRRGFTPLRAVRVGDEAIPSNRVRTCRLADPTRCPSAHGARIFGSRGRDWIRGTRGWDVVRAGRGDDVVVVRNGGRDRIGCGPGFDTVVKGRGDGPDLIGRDCERVLRR